MTTSLVFIECGNAAARTPFRSRVDASRRSFLDEGRLVEPTPEDLEEAWSAHGQGLAGQAGIVDHISFVGIRRLGPTQAFTNDAHFRAAGFETRF